MAATAALRAHHPSSTMASSESDHSLEEAAGELSCISALLSLSSPKCLPRSRDSSTTAEAPRPAKMAKLNHSSAPSTPRGVTQPSLDPGSEVWVNRWVSLKRGKYEGRKAFIVGITTKKFRVRVEGVEHQLEYDSFDSHLRFIRFYPSMFRLVDGGDLPITPKGVPVETNRAEVAPKAHVPPQSSSTPGSSSQARQTQISTPPQEAPKPPKVAPFLSSTTPSTNSTAPRELD